ncbi:MAG: DUF4349 domain-containing protein [Candidatus Nanopelagicales bacterium]
MTGTRRTSSAGAILAGTIVALALLTACGAGSDDSSESPGGGSGHNVAVDQDPARAAAPEAGTVEAAPADGDTTTITVATQDDTLLIRTASVQVRTDDVSDAVHSVEELATALQGTITSSQISAAPDEDESQARATLTIRVPEERFREAMRSVADLGEVLDQNENAQDVTTEVVDVNARVKSQQASVERVRALLAEATTIGEVVSVEAELARREADLDALLSRQATLADQSARATIAVELVGPEAVVAQPDEERGFRYGLAQGWEAFVASGAILLTMLGAVLPFAVAGLLILGVTLASLRARSRRSA